MGPRAGLSTILILGSIVLLFAIVFGQSMGNRVLSQIASRPSEISATPVPSPSASADDERTTPLWKRHQVISVATDPAFPDPRITPEPTPPPTPTPTPRPTAMPTDMPLPSDEPRYTSPPLPIPLVSAAPDESPPADEPASPAPSPTPTARGAKPRPEFTGRGYPSFPPSTPP
ncbi:MAG: hypothetical protein IAI48_03880 [Candidatus Eremiobacteraeota bacterium]|nr:hypothetical protein [Candidatus Eremiobacteraeota bacterium]